MQERHQVWQEASGLCCSDKCDITHSQCNWHKLSRNSNGRNLGSKMSVRAQGPGVRSCPVPCRFALNGLWCRQKPRNHELCALWLFHFYNANTHASFASFALAAMIPFLASTTSWSMQTFNSRNYQHSIQVMHRRHQADWMILSMDIHMAGMGCSTAKQFHIVL